MMYDDELEKASRIHYSFLPDPIFNEHIDLSSRYRPIQTLGGDYCSAFWLTEDRLAICMCDVVGHGVASALYAARVNTFVLAHARRVSHPCKLMTGLNHFLRAKLADVGVYTTFFTAFIDLDAMRLDYVNAAHPPAVWYSSTHDECKLLQPETTLLGFTEIPALECPPRSLPLQSGDRLLLYTDGLIERPPTSDPSHGLDLLQAFARENAQLNSSDFCDALFQSTDQTFGHPHDDQLILALAIR
ncbi:MAG: PP2C family protein-serine/threonine phosphatase [Pseudomonadota bacterium]